MLVGHKEGGVFRYSLFIPHPSLPFHTTLVLFQLYFNLHKGESCFDREKEEVFPELISLMCIQGLFQYLLSLLQDPTLWLN